MNAQPQHSDPDAFDETVELGLDGKPLLPPIHYLTPDEAWQMFDDNAQRLLGISGEEFVRRWEAGEYYHNDDMPNHSAIISVAMMRPFAKQGE